LLDETMSKSLRARGITAMTRHMEVGYLRPVPSRTPLRLEGLVIRSEGRKHWTEARILDSEGVTLANAKGLFIEVRGK
jgi:acyl-coenzyme A thioesterase PaaI-like protein